MAGLCSRCISAISIGALAEDETDEIATAHQILAHPPEAGVAREWAGGGVAAESHVAVPVLVRDAGGGAVIDLRLGDCLEILPTLADKSMDAVITDPPYGIDYQSARRIDKSQWKPKIENDKEPFLDWLVDVFRVVKDCGALVCFCRWDVEEIFKSKIERVGFVVKSQIIWDKVIHGMGDLNGSFAPQHENAWFAVKGDFRFWGKRPKTIIRVPRVPADEMVHPNEKPVALFTRLIDSIVPPNGNVLDCFVGSGNSAKAAYFLKRDYTGIDINEEYHGIAQKRIAEAQQQMVMTL